MDFDEKKVLGDYLHENASAISEEIADRVRDLARELFGERASQLDIRVEPGEGEQLGKLVVSGPDDLKDSLQRALYDAPE